jgi:Transglycosylase SLT domain
MRTIVVAVIVLLGISCALPELQPAASTPPVQTVKPPPAAAIAKPSGQPAPSGQAAPASAPKPTPVPIPTPAQAASVPPHSLDNVCTTLLTSAQDNDLPVPFFASLIWQESRLRDKALSPKGAMGIAQFMPQVAAKSGLQNPFDPSQALPASAKLLRGLFDQFGNLGYTAAAYNAGATRVWDWVDHGRALPRETRDYVKDITGRSIEAWRKKPDDDAGLRFSPQLPCRSLPAFAVVAQAQAQQANLDHQQAEQARAQASPSQHVTPSQQNSGSQTPAEARKSGSDGTARETRASCQSRPSAAIRHAAVRLAEREPPRIKRGTRERSRYAPRGGYRRA